MYNEEDFLQLSGIQHFAFCRRQWALAYIEMQWQENVRTVEGRLLHEKAHDASIKEVIRARKRPFPDRPGRISLALDMMEELRAVMADRFVLTLINRRIKGRPGGVSAVFLEIEMREVYTCFDYL